MRAYPPNAEISDHWPTVTLGGKETVSKSKTKKSQKRARGSLERLVRRYRRTGCSDPDCMCGGGMDEHPNGEWVDWDDVRRILGEVEWALMHLETNIDINGIKMGESDAADALRRALSSNDRTERQPTKTP